MQKRQAERQPEMATWKERLSLLAVKVEEGLPAGTVAPQEAEEVIMDSPLEPPEGSSLPDALVLAPGDPETRCRLPTSRTAS